MNDLADALMEILDAKKSYDEAWDKVEYDKGYFTYREQERLENATKRFENTLNELIDKRIEERKLTQ